MKITDEIARLNWIPHFPGRLLNKRRIDRRWRKPRVQFGMKFWFQKIGEEGINSTLKRRTQGIFVGHQDRTRTNLFIAKSGGMRCHIWIRQTLSDAREPMNLENWFGGLLPMATGSRAMITETKIGKSLANDEPELKLTKRVTADTRLMMPRIVVEKPQEVERRRFYVLSSDIETYGNVGSCPDTSCLHCWEKRQNRAETNSESESERLSRHSWREKPGGKHARTESLRERDREMRRARIELGAGDVPEEPGEKDDEQVAVRHADASGGYITENQHEEKSKRDIHVGKRGSRGSR